MTRRTYPIGGLIFQLSLGDNSDDPEFSEAIRLSATANATKISINNDLASQVPTLNHVSLIISETEVIEASATNGVCITAIDDLLAGSELNLLAKLKDDSNAKNAIEYAKQQLGKPYKFSFYPDENGLYCSELVCNAYPNIFKPHPMTFKDVNTNTTVPFWFKYYAQQGKDIPEGKLGSHPSSLLAQNELFEYVIKL